MGENKTAPQITLTQIMLDERETLITEVAILNADRDALRNERDALLNAFALMNVDLHARGILLTGEIGKLMSNIIKKYIKPKNAETAIREDKK